MDDADFFERRVGTTVRGKWTLERLLGVGGMAAVYAAKHKIGRTDAIKILHPEIASSGDARARFEQEAHAVNLFRHPGAVEIRDIDVTEDGAPFLVMELLDGEPLSARKDVSHDEALRIAAQVLDVLGAAHASGIIHRDVKPDNLFVLANGDVKVLDFGIARVRSAGGKGHKTRTGTTLGTVAYMPPEQVIGADIDARADLFAVGATLFRLFAKRHVHVADGEIDLAMKMANEPAPRLADVAPDAPEAVCMVVDRALAFDREKRYPDAATMRRDVLAAREGKTPPYSAERLAAGDDPRGGVTVNRPPSSRPAAEATAVVPPPAVPEAKSTSSSPSAFVPALASTERAPASVPASVAPAVVSVREPPPNGSKVPPRTRTYAIVGALATVVALVAWLALRGRQAGEGASMVADATARHSTTKPADTSTPTPPKAEPAPPTPPKAEPAPPAKGTSGKKLGHGKHDD